MPPNPTHKYIGPPPGRPPIAWSKISKVPVDNVSPSSDGVASQSSGVSAQSDQPSAYKTVRFDSVLPQVSGVSAHKEASLDNTLPQVSSGAQDQARNGVAPQSSGVSAQSNQQSAYKKVRFNSVLPQVSGVSAHKAVSLDSILPQFSGELQDQASDGRAPQSSGGLVLPQISGRLHNHPHYKGVPLTSIMLSSTPLQKESLPAQTKAYRVREQWSLRKHSEPVKQDKGTECNNHAEYRIHAELKEAYHSAPIKQDKGRAELKEA
jgi:hypothetical protein